MLFNTLTFFIFFSIVICLYYLLPHRLQNLMLLVASYFFYAWADWRFIFLILFSTVINYVCGIGIYRVAGQQKKKLLLSLCVVANLSFLGFFKYFNFFIENVVSLLSVLGLHANITVMHIILPVGISFYTFQTMSYTIDLYRGETAPTYNFIDFALFVSYFPHLVAGPIMRAKTLLPQIHNIRKIDKNQILDGVQLIFWGLFKKVFVADNLAIIVNRIYGNPEATGMEYIIATWAFAFQIYGDFSGYSDIARGTSKCIGIELVHNFKQPYFAINPSDFWRRWHISLSSWLKDYLYIPLGGNKKGTWKTFSNLSLTMLLGGLWHGAAWNFVIWGAYHGFLLCIYRIFGNSRTQSVQTSNMWTYMLKAFIMFQLTSLSWIFFRAHSLNQIILIFQSILNSSWLTPEYVQMLSKVMFFSSLPIFVMFFQTIKEIRPSFFLNSALVKYFQYLDLPILVKSMAYGILTYLLACYGAETQTFIYFQF